MGCSKKPCYTLCFCFFIFGSSVLASSVADAQTLSPAIYAGFGMGTNIGGLIGLGMEVGVGNYISFNAALGVWPAAMSKDNFDVSPFDFDVGMKIYPFKKWLYLGINYGIIDWASTKNFGITTSLEKTHGFTFSAGLRTPVWHGFYLSNFVGITDNYDVNHYQYYGSARQHFFPHFGLMLGYEFKPQR